jgi:hypothetical protein
MPLATARATDWFDYWSPVAVGRHGLRAKCPEKAVPRNARFASSDAGTFASVIVQIVRPRTLGAVIPDELSSALGARASLKDANLCLPNAATLLLEFPPSAIDPVGTVCTWLDDLRPGWRVRRDYAVAIRQPAS